jgi:hypothetical protein
MKIRSSLSLLAFTVATVLAWSQQAPNQAPTLADIARQKRSEKAKKVYTSEDMKAAPPMAEAAAPETTAEAKPMAPKSTEAMAAAEAKVADLRDREILLNKNIARFETSMATASAEGNEERVKSFGESLETARTALATTTQQRAAAEKELDDMKAAAAAAAATAKKPARKPAPKS